MNTETLAASCIWTALAAFAWHLGAAEMAACCCAGWVGYPTCWVSKAGSSGAPLGQRRAAMRVSAGHFFVRTNSTGIASETSDVVHIVTLYYSDTLMFTVHASYLPSRCVWCHSSLKQMKLTSRDTVSKTRPGTALSAAYTESFLAWASLEWLEQAFGLADTYINIECMIYFTTEVSNLSKDHGSGSQIQVHIPFSPYICDPPLDLESNWIS